MGLLDSGDIDNNFFNIGEAVKYFPKLDFVGVIEIALMAIMFYYIAKSLKNTRAWVILKGLAVVFLFYLIAYLLNLNVIVFIFKSFFLFIGIAIVVIIQPELRKMIEKIGAKNINKSNIRKITGSLVRSKKSNIVEEYRVSDKSIQEIVKGCFLMSKVKTGALIVIEGNIPLSDIVESGIQINADITSALLINIFEKNTPLHDGALIIRDDKIIAGTCYLPLSSNNKINKDLGTRHRAAIGVSEISDACVIVVSEETGNVSFIKNGDIKYNVSREELFEHLNRVKTKNIHLKNKKSIKDINIGLRIASLFVAAVMWVLVISSVNPVSTVTFRNIPIEYKNSELITETGKTFTANSTGYVNVTVKDRKDVVDSIKNDDFTVVADFSKLSYVNCVPLEIETIDYPNSDFILSQESISISMEDVISTEIEIEVEMIGETDSKYYISKLTLSDGSIVVSGAKSIIDTLNKAVVIINESEITENCRVKLEPKIYDKNGSEVDKSTITINKDEVYADVLLYSTKEVPLKLSAVFSNNNLEELVKGTTCDIDSVVIAGPDDVLEAVNEINIDIPIDINIEDISKNTFIKNIILQDYVSSISENIIVTSQYNRVNLTIEFLEFSSKTLSIESKDIEITNLDSERQAEIKNKTLEITLLSTSTNLENLTAKDLKAYVNLNGVDLGEHKIEVEFGGLADKDFMVIGDNTVQIIVS